MFCPARARRGARARRAGSRRAVRRGRRASSPSTIPRRSAGLRRGQPVVEGPLGAPADRVDGAARPPRRDPLPGRRPPASAWAAARGGVGPGGAARPHLQHVAHPGAPPARRRARPARSSTGSPRTRTSARGRRTGAARGAGRSRRRADRAWPSSGASAVRPARPAAPGRQPPRQRRAPPAPAAAGAPDPRPGVPRDRRDSATRHSAPWSPEAGSRPARAPRAARGADGAEDPCAARGHGGARPHTSHPGAQRLAALGPYPGISPRSSTDLKPPCSSPARRGSSPRSRGRPHPACRAARRWPC